MSRAAGPLPDGSLAARGDAVVCSGSEFVRLVYRLAQSRATGVLTIEHPVAGTKRLVLRRGHLICPGSGSGSGSAGDQRRRDAVRGLERVAGQSSVRWSFDGGVAAYPPGGSLQTFNLARWGREHLEAQLDGTRAQAMVEELSGVRLALRDDCTPDPAICDPVDLRILAVLATPRRIDQIAALARAPRFRLLSFVHFLRSIDAVTLEGVAVRMEPLADTDSAALRALGLSRDADATVVKRAYRRIARALHPDLQSDANETRRRQLEARLAQVNTAYQRLTDHRR